MEVVGVVPDVVTNVAMIQSFLFRVEPFDPMTLGIVAGAILTLALLVSARPALRAARVDLGAVLKSE